MQSPDVSQALTTLAQQLGTTVEMVWQVALTLPAYNAIKSAIWGLLWAVLSIPPAVMFVRAKKERDRLLARREFVGDEVSAPYFFGGALTAMCLLVSAVYLGWALDHLAGVLNPQAYAMQFILGALSK